MSREVNYISEINAFYKHMEEHALPLYTQVIWHNLMHLNNRCGWSEWFSVDNMRLATMCDIHSEKTLVKYRDILIEAGLITIKKGSKWKPNQYRFCLFSDKQNDSYTVPDTVQDFKTVPRTVQDTVQDSQTVRDTVQEHSYTVPDTAINKQRSLNSSSSSNEMDIPNELYDVGFKNAVDFFCNNIDDGLTPYKQQKLSQWCDDVGSELVLLALQNAIESTQKPSLSYIDAIIRAWTREDIKTPEQVTERQLSRQNSRKQADIVQIREYKQPPMYDPADFM